MANKFNLISGAVAGSIPPTNGIDRPVFTDVGGNTPIADGGIGVSHGIDAWNTGSRVRNASTLDPLPDGSYTCINDGTLLSININGGDGIINSVGIPTDSYQSTYSNCEDYFNGSPTEAIYTNTSTGVWYSSPFGLDNEKLEGVIPLYPDEVTFENGLQISSSRICPYQYTLYDNCNEASIGSNGEGTIYTNSQASGFVMGTTEIFTDIALTIPYTSNIGYIYEGSPYYFETGSTGIVENYSQCIAGTDYQVYSTFQDLFDAIGEYNVYINPSDSLTVGTYVYTDQWLSTPSEDFVYNGLHYVLTDGEVTSIEDYGIAPFTTDLYTNCSLSTSITEPYYFRSDGMLETGNKVYTNTAALTPAGWTPLSYTNFVYNSTQYTTQGDGTITGLTYCGT